MREDEPGCPRAGAQPADALGLLPAQGHARWAELGQQQGMRQIRHEGAVDLQPYKVPQHPSHITGCAQAGKQLKSLSVIS